MAAKTDSRSLPNLPNKPGKTNWVEKAGGLPKLIERVAKHLHSEKNRTVSTAIATAVNWAKKMCASGTAFGGHVKVGAKAQAAACKAVAQWNAKRGKAALTEAISLALTEVPLGDEELGDLVEALCLLEAGPAVIDAGVEADLADFPLAETLADLEAAGDAPAACPFDLGSLELSEAAAKSTPMSHSKRKPGESLGQYGSRLKREDASLQRGAAAAKKGKTRSGKSSGGSFEQQHPRGRGGTWVLKPGAQGSDVKQVQAHVGAKQDGKYGKDTKAKVAAFQRARGLQVDGVVGAQTVAEIKKKGAGKSVKPGMAKGKLAIGTPKPHGRKKRHPSRAVPGKLIESPPEMTVEVGDLALVEAYNVNQPRDRGGRWRKTIAKLRPGESVDIGHGVGVQRNRNPSAGYKVYGGRDEPTSTPSVALAATEAVRRTPTAEGFETHVDTAVGTMSGNDPSEKGTTAWRRQAFLTVRTAMGRQDVGISLESDPDWAGALAWWEKKGRKMLAGDPEMRDWMARFGDDTARKMVKAAGGSKELTETLADDVGALIEFAMAAPWKEEDHPRVRGKFARKLSSMRPGEDRTIPGEVRIKRKRDGKGFEIHSRAEPMATAKNADEAAGIALDRAAMSRDPRSPGGTTHHPSFASAVAAVKDVRPPGDKADKSKTSQPSKKQKLKMGRSPAGLVATPVLDMLISDTALTESPMTAAERKNISKGDFVFPDKAPGSGSYPIHDRAHGANALARSKGKPEEAAVKRKVCSRYSDLPACKA